MTLTLIGCASNANRVAQDHAAARKGLADAGIVLSEQPAECGRKVPHARIAKGMEARTIIKRERGQLDVANNRIVDCFAFNEALREDQRR